MKHNQTERALQEDGRAGFVELVADQEGGRLSIEHFCDAECQNRHGGAIGLSRARRAVVKRLMKALISAGSVWAEPGRGVPVGFTLHLVARY